MSSTFIQPGNVVEFLAGANIAAGDVVLVGNVLGVATQDIAKDTSGPVQITGVFVCPKVSGAVIAQGEPVTWDDSAAAFDDKSASPSTGDVTGGSAFAWTNSGDGETTIQIRFTGVPGTIN